MKREELLKSKEYWTIQIQTDLYELIEKYMRFANLNRTELASKLNVTKGYITQLLNGDFDHKISKFVELSLATGKVPIVSFVDLDKYIKADSVINGFSTHTYTKPVEYIIFDDLSETEKIRYKQYNPSMYTTKAVTTSFSANELS